LESRDGNASAAIRTRFKFERGLRSGTFDESKRAKRKDQHARMRSETTCACPRCLAWNVAHAVHEVAATVMGMPESAQLAK
jgi:hypothetical protein